MNDIKILFERTRVRMLIDDATFPFYLILLICQLNDGAYTRRVSHRAKKKKMIAPMSAEATPPFKVSAAIDSAPPEIRSGRSGLAHESSEIHFFSSTSEGGHYRICEESRAKGARRGFIRG